MYTTVCCGLFLYTKVIDPRHLSKAKTDQLGTNPVPTCRFYPLEMKLFVFSVITNILNLTNFFTNHQCI